VKIWQAVGKLRRRHGLVLRGEPRELNARPRKRLGYRTPEECYVQAR
jgi:hypothetical protein